MPRHWNKADLQYSLDRVNSQRDAAMPSFEVEEQQTYVRCQLMKRNVYYLDLIIEICPVILMRL